MMLPLVLLFSWQTGAAQIRQKYIDGVSHRLLHGWALLPSVAEDSSRKLWHEDDNGRLYSELCSNEVGSTLVLLQLVLPFEVLVGELLGVDAGHINLGGSGNNVPGVHAAKRNAIDLVRSGHQQQT